MKKRDWVVPILMVAGLVPQAILGSTFFEGTALDKDLRPEHFSFALPGTVREVKSFCGAGSCSSFVLLRPPSERGGGGAADSPDGGPAEATLELWQLLYSSASGSAIEPRMQRLRALIPEDAGRLALCKKPEAEGGTATSEQDPFLVMFQARGSVFFVDPSAGESPLDSGTRVGSDKWSAPARPWKSDCSEILMVGPGEARLLRLAGRGTRRSVLSSESFPISLAIRRNTSGLTLESPEVRRIDHGGSDLIVVGPKVYDSLRLETIVFPPTDAAKDWLVQLASDPDASELGAVEEGTTSARRLWSRLPAAERILKSHYLTVHGELVLVVVTKEADKMGLLERKKLRLFRLAEDRTRLGKLPFFEILTASRLWQRLDVKFVDVSADGVKDLVLVQPEGLGGEPTVADVFLATAPLQFSTKKSRTLLQTGLAWWSLENDWDGDGLMDVVVLDDEILQFHSGRSREAMVGRRHKKRRGFWSTEPSYTIALKGLERAGDAEGDADVEAKGKGTLKTEQDVDDVEKDEVVEKSAEESEGFAPGFLRKVWVDSGVLVIPTHSSAQQMTYTGNGVVITVSDTEPSTQSRGSDQQKLQSLVHVVRAPAQRIVRDQQD